MVRTTNVIAYSCIVNSDYSFCLFWVSRSNKRGLNFRLGGGKKTNSLPSFNLETQIPNPNWEGTASTVYARYPISIREEKERASSFAWQVKRRSMFPTNWSYAVVIAHVVSVRWKRILHPSSLEPHVRNCVTCAASVCRTVTFLASQQNSTIDFWKSSSDHFEVSCKS